MSISWTTTSKANATQGVKVLCWGKSGIGKTVLCATAPRPVILSAESGLLSLGRKNLEKLYGVNAPGISYDIPVMEINTVEQLRDAHTFFVASHYAKDFDTVCIDSASEIAEVILNNAKRTVKDPRQAYGQLIEQMETIIRQFRDLEGKHVYISAKAESFKDELTGVVMNGPSMPGSKLGQKLPYFFDEVFELAINKPPGGEPYRYLRTQPDLQSVAKDRSGALDAIEEPHLGKIFNKILQGV